MKTWPRHPLIYEINTWVWLGELTGKYGKAVTLSTVPTEEWDAIASYGFDAVWLMGVWKRSPAGIAVANRNSGLLEDFRRALADFQPEDNVGSPYCIRDYAVDGHLGGRKGLAAARNELAGRGLRLILDFVPNHVAPDHPWVKGQPAYFISGTPGDAEYDPASFLKVGKSIFACGRDPFFPAWPDVLQLNAFSPGLRQAAADTLADIAGQCDGVRCDMAMLFINRIFEGTWGVRAGKRPEAEFWTEVITAVRKDRPDFLFMAEAYWDLEWELQQQGFDYCYDKRLYDRLEKDTAENVRLHLCAEPAFQKKMVRFLENHDEPRASAAFSPPQVRAAAVVMATIPGAKLFHEGQFEGRKVRLPVFLGRRPDETPDPELPTFYRKLLLAASLPELRGGDWHLCDRSGWPDNPGYLDLVAWCWEQDGNRSLIVVNLSDRPAQGQVRVPWDDIAGKTWRMTDFFTGEVFERGGDEMRHPGLYVDLSPRGFHFLTGWTPV
ncbi:MAG: alpha-amylase family glycosyl hydrolase [Thermodesulfobacteriota bacterium]